MEKMHARSLLLGISLMSIGVVTVKIYPLLFLLFIYVYLCSSRTIDIRIFLPVVAFVFFATWFGALNMENGFDTNAWLKLSINMFFLVFAASWINRISTEEAVRIMLLSASWFVLLSSLQAIWNVWVLDLWDLPLNNRVSEDLYQIMNSPVWFGDANKNVWATKHAIFFMVLIVFCYLGYGNKWSGFCILIGLFPVIYVISRASQVALLCFFVALFFYHMICVRRDGLFSLLLFLFLTPFFLYFLSLLLRFDINDLKTLTYQIGEHRGDGFFARLIIWHYILENVNWLGYILGNGILSFPAYTKHIFPENNPHNVFLNIILDFGLITFLTYSWLLVVVFFRCGLSILMFVPFVLLAMVQYLGYDADIIVLFLAAICLQLHVANATKPDNLVQD